LIRPQAIDEKESRSSGDKDRLPTREKGREGKERKWCWDD